MCITNQTKSHIVSVNLCAGVSCTGVTSVCDRGTGACVACIGTSANANAVGDATAQGSCASSTARCQADGSCAEGDEECVWIDNQYWSYGDYETIHDVSDYMDCYGLCKDDSECTNFSYGKEGHGYAKQCFKKRGGSAQGRSEFISSPRNISKCSCGKGGFIFHDFNMEFM